MTDISRATPRPWKTAHSDPAEGVDVWWLCAGEGNAEKELGSIQGGYPQERGEANAALIVTAANCFDELVAALQEAVIQIDYMNSRWPTGTGEATLTRARAVLAKVTT